MIQWRYSRDAARVATITLASGLYQAGLTTGLSAAHGTLTAACRWINDNLPPPKRPPFQPPKARKSTPVREEPEYGRMPFGVVRILPR